MNFQFKIGIMIATSIMVWVSVAFAQTKLTVYSRPVNSEPQSVSSCVLGHPQIQPSWVKGRRPALTAKCNYDLDVAYTKVAEMLDAATPKTKIDQVEKIFGLPSLETIDSNTRMSTYEVTLFGAGGWKLYVWISEWYFPLNGDDRKFIPGLHPVRLGRFDESSARVSMSLYYPPPTITQLGGCPEKIDFKDYAITNGWIRERIITPPTDGGWADPLFRSRNGEHFSLTPTFRDQESCLTQLMLWTDSKRKTRSQH